MKKLYLLLMSSAITLICAGPVLAEEVGATDTPWKKFSLSLGGFRTALDSKVSMGSGSLGVGLEVDVEDALKLESTTSVFRTEVFYRAGKSRRHKLELSYMDLSRKSTATLKKAIDFNDKTYSVGTRVDSIFNLQIIMGGYNYSFFQDDRFNLGLGLGVYVMPIKVSIDASGFGKEETSITAPLPVLSLGADFAFTPKVILKQRLDLFWLEYGNFKGSLTNARLALEYNMFKHLGLGIGLDSFRLRIRAEGEDYPEIDFTGDIEFSYIGAMLYANIYY